MDKQSAEAYVRDLFRYVLDRKATSDHEIGEWANELLSGRSPIEVFRLFALSSENRDRLAALQIRGTKYPNGHFYSPVVNTKEIESDRPRIFKRNTVRDVEMHPDQQINLWSTLLRHFSAMPFGDEPDRKHRYYYNNSSYGYGDACIYWSLIATLRPSRIVEVGCGFTSALALDSIDYFNLETKCTFIDPYPQLFLKVAAPIDTRHELIADRVQNVDIRIVEQLEANDILFIDSSHVVKTGSDVHFELSELLPRLRRGSVVHFHDIFYPFEYPEKWIIDENHSWNEIYFLQTFLMYNNDFRIMYFNDYFRKIHGDLILQSVPPSISSRIMLNPGGGLWLRRM